MSISRRSWLKLGGATLVVLAGGVAYRGVEQGVFASGTGPAYAPWRNWREAKTANERIVAAAILAANPHNSQPWIFRLTAGAIDLFADPTRQIGVIDPFRREMYIGLGCAIANMRLAAQAEGFAAEVELTPDANDNTHVAELTFKAAAADASPLFAAIPLRSTNRAAYDTTRPLAAAVFDELGAQTNDPDLRLILFKDAAERAKFGDVAVRAAEALIADDQQSRDSGRWWRHDWGQVQEQADGLTIDAQALGGAVSAVAKILPDLSREQNDAIFVKTLRDSLIPTAAAFGILAVRDAADFAQRLKCGQAWQRMHLWATTQGLAMQPLNQMCERTDRERQLGLEPTIGKAVRSLVDDDNWHAIMPFRMGYPTIQALKSPRRSLDKVIA